MTTYAFTNCLALGPEDANTIWRARHPGKVTVVGGPLAERAVPLQECGQGVGSLRESTNLWAINVPDGLRERFSKPVSSGEFPVFSVDGRYMMPARWPNGGKFHFMNKERFVLQNGPRIGLMTTKARRRIHRRHARRQVRSCECQAEGQLPFALAGTRSSRDSRR
ncbi:MAG: hypothetical protein MJ249_14855 [Kiritimatiellae bacterium]|nr:hypothetical protein [Kiritimatiellia bacterium]